MNCPRFLQVVPCFVLILVWSTVAVVYSSDGNTVKTAPNIVVIMADDLGYGDVRPLNSQSTIPTPAFDRLAERGMVFTDAHSPSGVCTPTRYGLLCGRYPWRTSMKRGVLGGYSRPLIDRDRQTVASVLKQAGYTTSCVGKWHLGLGWQWNDRPEKDINNMGIAGGQPGRVDYTKPLTHGPTTLGFDSSFIIPASLDMSPYVYIRDDKVTRVPDRVIPKESFPMFYRRGEIAEDFKIDEVLDRLTTEACEFIAESAEAEDPFFLYFPLTAPHKPVMPHARFKEKTELGPYGDFILQVDWTVGQVIDALEKAGEFENTLLIVTSDNGSFMNRFADREKDHVTEETIQGYNESNHTANGPWRGTKADIWEGGHRVPFFVSWPERVAGGTKSDAVICHTDILATAAEVAGQEFDQASAEDSFSFLTALLQKEHVRKPVIHQSGGGHLAIRDGKWKLVMSTGSGGRQQPRGKAFEKPFHLFDLDSDPGEQDNLIEQHAEVADRLYQAFLELSHGDHSPQ